MRMAPDSWFASLRRLGWAPVPPLIGALCLVAAAQAQTLAPPSLGAPVRTRVMVAQRAPAMWILPMWVARALGYFEQEGLELEVNLYPDADQAIKVVAEGGAQLGVNQTAHIVKMARAGHTSVAFAALAGQWPSDLVIRTTVAQEKGITADKPYVGRVAALKGLRIGARPGMMTNLLREILRSGGLAADTDVTIIDPGSNEGLVTALRAGQLDAFVSFFPFTEVPVAEGIAQYLIRTARGEVPTVNGFLHTALVASPEYLAQQPQVIQAATRAIWRAQRYLHEHRAEALALLQDRWRELLYDLPRPPGERVGRQLVALGFEAAYPSVPPNPAVGKEQLHTAMECLTRWEPTLQAFAWDSIASNTAVEAVRAQPRR